MPPSLAQTAKFEELHKNGGKNLKEAILSKDAQGGYYDEEDSGADFTFHLKSFINIIRRNAALIAAVVVGVVFAGIVITMLMTPTFKSTTQILIEDQADQIIEGSELQKLGAAGETDRFLQTQLGIIQSRALAKAVVQAGKLDRDAGFFEAVGSAIPESSDMVGQALDETRRVHAINALLNSLEVVLPPDSRIVELTITTRDPALSAKLANLYADRYVEYNLSRKYQSSSYARRFLADQLEETRRKLTQSEQDLNQYARAAGLIRIGSQDGGGGQDAALSVTNNKLIQLNTAAAAATAERISTEDRWKTLSAQAPLSISEVNSNTAIMQLVTDKARAEGQLADELSKHLEGFATVKAKRAEIAELDRRIVAFANSIKKSAQIDFESALEKEHSLANQVNTLRGEALREQDSGVQYSVLKRVADTYRTLYESLLSRFNQINATAGSASNNVTIIDRADIPRSPSSPNLMLNTLLSVLTGIICAAIAVALREILDDAVRSPDDVEKKLGIPLLGLIPLRKEGDINSELSDHRSSVSEAYRSLVTNLRYSTSTGLPHVLAVTSSRESEGKSTTARALANDIAMLGKNVLIVDTDLRRPTLHHVMEDVRASGLTDLLIGQKKFDEVVHQAPHLANLSYVTGLPSPPDPALILAGDGLAKFIAEARDRFDVIVLDCPPLLGLSDAPLLANHADGVLFVIDASSFHRGAVKSALRRLALINARILGVALNRFTPKSGGDDYSYYAYNYYSYGSKKD